MSKEVKQLIVSQNTTLLASLWATPPAGFHLSLTFVLPMSQELPREGLIKPTTPKHNSPLAMDRMAYLGAFNTHWVPIVL